MKKVQKRSPDPQRREFLRVTATTGAGLVVSAALPGLASAVPGEAPSTDSDIQKGYRLTPHIAAYYKTTAG